MALPGARCPLGSFTESVPEVPARARVTGRVRRAIGAAVGDANRAVSEVADAFGVSWPTAHAAVIDAAEAALAEPEPTAVLGIDETRRGKPRWELDPVTGVGGGSTGGTPGSSTSPATRAC